jgi:hypothetical protein
MPTTTFCESNSSTRGLFDTNRCAVPPPAAIDGAVDTAADLASGPPPARVEADLDAGVGSEARASLEARLGKPAGNRATTGHHGRSDP